MAKEGRPRTGLRERKKQETREALSWAAVRLAVERGLENVLVEDIAADAGVSPRTFNNYFSSKYEAICARAVDRGRRLVDTLRERPADEPLREAVRAAVLEQYHSGGHAPDRSWTAGVRLVTSSPALWAEFLRAHAVVQNELAEAIADRIGTDTGRDMFPHILAGAVTAAINVATERWVTVDPPVPMEDVITEALDQLGRINERIIGQGDGKS